MAELSLVSPHYNYVFVVFFNHTLLFEQQEQAKWNY